MKSCGVIVEYNPFHNGHVYHLQQAREFTNCDVVIAVMSGNFLQRGEPAIIDKWVRAQAALNCGVDLVVELPLVWSVQSADYFAKGGIKLLQSLACDALCFGTDSPEELDYQAFGEFALANQDVIDRGIKEEAAELSYPQKMTNVFRKLYPELALDFQSPNHILGLSYAKENARYPQPMALFPVKRKAAAYHDQKAVKDIASATAIRRLLLEKKSAAAFMPQPMSKFLEKAPLTTWESFWPYLRYRLVTTTTAELKEIYQVSEGLEYRIKKAANAATFSEFIQQLKSKRYTWTRLQRLAVYLLLNIKPDEIKAQQATTPLRILGFTPQGQAYLKMKKKEFLLPVISKIGNKEAKEQYLTLRGDQVYQLGGSPEQNFGRIPLKINLHT